MDSESTSEQVPAGSEWRKWDLHVHAPGTKLSDDYASQDGQPDVAQFCQVVHGSGMAAVAITDYFSFETYFAVMDKYSELYPDDGMLLLPNLELRLPVAVNQEDQEVNLHLIFRPTLTREEANKFLERLNTSTTTGSNRTPVTCADLRSTQDFQSATVSLNAIDPAIRATFGEHATVPSNRQEHLLVVASAKGDGIRAGGSGIERKKLLTDEIDKYSDRVLRQRGITRLLPG